MIIVISSKAFHVFNNESLEVYEKNYPNNYHTFVENKFIIEDNIDEIEELRIFNKIQTYNNRLFELTIIPSMDCNLHCWYCFENHIPNSKMSNEVQESIIKYIQKKIENKDILRLKVEYFGGEPLLYFDDVAYPLGIALKSICEQNNITISFSFITNASLITPKMIDQFVELNAGFQITLDGNKNKHDKIRFQKQNHQGTYQQIINNIYLLTERIENTKINIRINYDEKTLEGIEDILKDLSGLDRKKVIIHLERVWQTPNLSNNLSLKKAINLFIINGFEISYLNWNFKGYTCKAERFNQLVVNYDGKVFKCTGRNFTDELSDGVIKENGDVQWKPGRLGRRIGKATFENHLCLNCEMLPQCMGPCSQKQIEVGPDRLHDVCMLNALEMEMAEYLEYTYNNMATIQKII